MTCIVGIVNKKTGKITVAGDSFWGGFYNKGVYGDDKIFIKDKMIFGCCGSCRMISLLKYSLNIPKISEKQDIAEYMNTTFIDKVRKCFKDGGFMTVENNLEEIKRSSFIVGFRGELFMVAGDLQVSRRKQNYEAVGAGQDFALATMVTLEQLKSKMTDKEKALKALEVTTELSPLVIPPYHVLELEN